MPNDRIINAAEGSRDIMVEGSEPDSGNPYHKGGLSARVFGCRQTLFTEHRSGSKQWLPGQDLNLRPSD
jgi:hypothetical protein